MKKILLAISDAALSNLIQKALEKEGHAILLASDGDGALSQMRTLNPDLALIDLALPKKNGYEVLEEKSFDRMITKIPVIVVSNSGDPIEIRRIPSTSSVKDFIIKVHITAEEVLKKVDGVFKGVIDQNKEVEATSTPSVAKAKGKKILWVEDDRLLSSILLKKFEGSGHTVLKADNGEQALAFMETDTPDIIVVDILLPGMDGFEVLQKIKMNEKNRNIPVIVLSNTSKPTDLEKAKMLGAQKFLLKAAVSLDQIIKEVVVLAK